MTTQMMYVHALSPIRVGTGQGVGIIDLPVIREKHTDWPYLPGSSLKGVLRDACVEAGVDEDDIRKVFGPDSSKPTNDDKAGGAVFADLRLLFLPVRCYQGSFAWVTSPLVLQRWLRDRQESQMVVPAVNDDSIMLPGAATRATIADGKYVYLEDLKLTIGNDNATSDLVDVINHIADACLQSTWKPFFVTRVGIISDKSFTYLSRTAMEVTARNRIQDGSKTVKNGQLWWEEAVPAESIFAGPLVPTRQGLEAFGGDPEAIFNVVRQGAERSLQIGANATVGRGIARVLIPTSSDEGVQP